ncbi:MAG: hypothetical protein GXY36_06220 [Chloroflexi bacterium]|nr:hypothetical protein [Chloroflexota bacterium]
MDEVPSEAKTEAKVITVTLNPSLDRTLVTHFLAVGYHNRTTGPTRLDPAGRGVSVSRALYALGVPTHAIILLGRDATGRSYQSLLAEEQFPITILRREGTTRSNIDIKDTGHNHETIVLEESTGVEQAHLEMVADMIQQLVAPGDRVVFAGSVPEGVRTDVYAWLTTVAQTAGARVAINAGGGESLLQSLRANPRMIYLTQTQLEGLFNFPVRTHEDVIYCAQQLHDQGAVQVLVAMQKVNDIVLLTAEGTWMVDLPEIDPGTHGGTAEALIAGFLSARMAGQSYEEALSFGAAAATFTGAQVGNAFGTAKDLEQYTSQIEVLSADVLADLMAAQQEAHPDEAPDDL